MNVRHFQVSVEETIDVLELNHLRRELVLDFQVWDRRLHMMDSLTKENCHTMSTNAPCLKNLPESLLEESKPEISIKQENMQNSLDYAQSISSITDTGKPLLRREQGDTTVSHFGLETNMDEVYHQSVEGSVGSAGLHVVSGPCEIQNAVVVADELKLEKTLQKSESSASNLSDRIDLAWTGSSVETLTVLPTMLNGSSLQNVMAPIRIRSFDSGINFKNRLSPVDDPNVSIRRAYSQRPRRTLERTSRGLSPAFTNKLSLSGMMDGEGRMLLSQSVSDVVIPVYDDEPSSMIAHAMTVSEYHSFMLPLLNLQNELDGADQPQPRTGNDSHDIHLTVSFEDEDSFSVDKAKFSVTCYFAKQFDAVRRKCCADELDYIRSLSRCKRWSAQGGKSNAYFAKTLDDRFVIKQVTRTELDSFEDYATEYFKYLTESISSGSPFCLAKVLGLYQVCSSSLFSCV
jgi:1-phosphatidylinositol-3-phosphate 5-kinase